MPPVRKRRRAAALVETPTGIVIVLMRHLGGMLPSGGVKPDESEQAAAVRELAEETGLVADQVMYLFHAQAYAHTTAVFWVAAPGQPQPRNEIDGIAFYAPGALVRLSPETLAIVQRFYALKATNPEPWRLFPSIRDVPTHL